MENYRHLILLKYLAFGGALFVLPFFILGYSDETTHPAITQEIVKHFNKSFPKQEVSLEEAEWIIQGSIDEDKDARWMHHFYDPVHNRGLVLENDAFPKNQELALIGSAARGQWISSKEWAQKSETQSKILSKFTAGIVKNYYHDENDYSWERAIYEYAWGDKQRGLESLGHVLHLIEDASVPDHSRNDPHPPVLDMGSPYESWTKKFDRNNIDVTLTEKPTTFSSLEDYFDSMASYSNNNFFSKDTIFKDIYYLPKIDGFKLEKLSDGKLYKFGYKNSSRLILIEESTTWREPQYYIDDIDHKVLSDYWSLLSKQAVLHGAGVVKLFFDEVEKEKHNKILYEKNRSWLGKNVDSFKNMAFGFASIFYGTSVKLADLDEELEESQPAEQPKKENRPVTPSKPVALKTEEQQKAKLETFLPLPVVPLPVQQPKPRQSSNTSPSLPILGVGGPPPPAEPPPPKRQPAPPPQQESSQSTTSSSLESTPSPSITTETDTATTTASSTPISTEENNSTTASSTPSTSLPSTGNQTGTTTLVISECSQSLSQESCLIATSTIALSWSASNTTDFDHFEITCETNVTPCAGFSISPGATSTTYALPSKDAHYTFRARAFSTSGNAGTEDIKTVKHVTRSVVINEIAWSGTSPTKSQDEWIELFNPSAHTIDLSAIRLRSLTDDKPNVLLSGILPPQAYYLIERTDDSTISDITASTTAPFGGGSGAGLSNAGEVLALEYEGVVIDQTPEIAACGGWCGGAAGGQHFSMERFDPNASGEPVSNWSSWIGFLANGLNADEAPIKGTPGKRNSVNYLISNTTSGIAANQTIGLERSPYIIPSSFIIQSGSTLTVSPGVVIKFFNIHASLTVNGTLRAEGTAENPIVFTSFKDDTVGGDTNNDGSATSPAPGDWGSIKIAADGSVFDHVRVSYGGLQDMPFANHWTNLRVENSSFSLRNSVIEHSGTYGAFLSNVSGTIEGNTIRLNNLHPNLDSTGFYVFGGNLVIQNNTFMQNGIGLALYHGLGENSFTVTGNIFTQNTLEAVSLSNTYPSFSNNTAEGNGTNGIALGGHLTQDYTFSANLPFVILGQLSILAEKIATFVEGTIVKLSGGGISVLGKIIVNGSENSRVYFTSLRDDSIGGDTNNDGQASLPQPGDWQNITFTGSSSPSLLSYATVRYGGTTHPTSAEVGALRVKNTSLDIINTIIEENYNYGAEFHNATSTSIMGSIFRNHRSPVATGINYALNLFNSSPLIKNTLFQNNRVGINADGNSSVQNGGGNVFEDNTTNTQPADLIP